MKIGVLALQGDFEAHIKALKLTGFEACEIKKPNELDCIDGLVIPGGESTTMLKLIDKELEQKIISFSNKGKIILGTCAGVILLADEVTNPSQRSFKLIPIKVQRNAFGRQVNSFISNEILPQYSLAKISDSPISGMFIRAPKIMNISKDVEVLATYKEEIVFVRYKNIFACTFHPELEPNKASALYEIIKISLKDKS